MCALGRPKEKFSTGCPCTERAQRSGLYETEGHDVAETLISQRHAHSLRFNIPEVPETVCKLWKK